ncbi:DNA-directed RNA polymerase subunit beta [Microbacterium sp.]|uniref:DNA-directed RNA polymerase subunit beta n=1 Tax=Microbacterium sp. TaxID=51671 RepID=UPI0035C70118
MDRVPEQFHRPIRRPPAAFDNIVGAVDPAEQSRIAHATASALLDRARKDASGETTERLIAFAAEHGIDEIAELWAHSPARSLPGALWRLYLLQLAIRDDGATTALLYERGRVELRTADAVIAGAPAPASPEELVALVDTILRGVFQGDFAIALDRAAAYCRVQASGATHLADDYEASEPQRASDFTRRALRLSGYATDLSDSSAAWRIGALS